ncbi:hypothetical protein DRQ36_03525 [bacterium]|nr:MAG: hypothetical protein DRQ36_03525 [bacterium]
MDIDFPYIGEIFALATALTWAMAVILFKKSGEKVHPIALNGFKNSLAFVLILMTMSVMRETVIMRVSARDYFLLILSGAIGIGISDTLFFKSLNLLGAARSSIVGCLYSPSIITLSILFLGERFTFLQIFGTSSIILAIATASSERNPGDISRRDLLLGIFLNVLSTLGFAIGIVMIKPILNNSPVLWATEVRLFGGIIALIPIFLFHPQKRLLLSSLVSTKSWGYTISASFVGTYIALILWLAGMKYTQASTAAVLNQTSNIWVFVFAALFLREKMTSRKVIAIILASIGVFLVALGQNGI